MLSDTDSIRDVLSALHTRSLYDSRLNTRERVHTSALASSAYDLWWSHTSEITQIQNPQETVKLGKGLRTAVVRIKSILRIVWHEKHLARGFHDDSLNLREHKHTDNSVDFIIFDRRPRRRDENLLLARELLLFGNAVRSPRLSIVAKLRATLKTIFLAATFVRSAKSTVHRINAQSLKLIRLLNNPFAADTLLIYHIQHAFGNVALNYAIIPEIVRLASRRARRLDRVQVIVFRSGGEQIARNVRAMRESQGIPVYSIFIPHSSATGESVPEAAINGDFIACRSRYQAVQMTHKDSLAQPHVVGRIVASPRFDLQGSDRRQTSLRPLIVAFTHRGLRASNAPPQDGITLNEWRMVEKLVKELSGDFRVTMRFKDWKLAIEQLNAAKIDPATLGMISRRTLFEDLSENEVCLVIRWSGYTSTVLHDAAASGLLVLNTDFADDARAQSFDQSKLAEHTFVSWPNVCRLVQAAFADESYAKHLRMIQSMHVDALWDSSAFGEIINAIRADSLRNASANQIRFE